MKICIGCNKVYNKQNKRYCSNECYYKNRKYHHSECTKNKIKKSNTGKVFTEKRKKAISKANIKKLTENELKKLKELWELKYVNPDIIRKIVGLSKRVYNRAFKKHCEIEQIKFNPSDMYPEEYETLIKLAKNDVYYVDIAKKLNRGKKQVFNLIKKLGMEPNTKNPDAYKGETSKLELEIINKLKNSGIKLETQWHFKGFYFDGKIINKNIVIEIHGDYWHCNPKIYKNGPINEMQKAALRRDFCKKDKIEKAGFKRFVIWENDYKNNPEKVIKKTINFILNNGE
jgi:G:T-mismatch repair DNA endonuclease (very short patch repair protein)